MDARGGEDEGFASYLARYLRARRGFDAAPAGFDALAAACDILLIHDNPDLRVTAVACIVDRDARPGAAFGLPPEDTRAAARAWMSRRQARGRTPSLVVTIFEVGRGAAGAEDERRLASYRTAKAFGRGLRIGAALADPGRRSVWTSERPWFGTGATHRLLRRLISGPRLAEADLAPAAVAPDLGRAPLLTCAILALLAAVFAAETSFPVEPWTGALHATTRNLLAFGGVDRLLVLDQGEWWRMATAPLLHADAFHLLFNGWALWLVGRLAERLVGAAWFGATFALAALAGSALSIAVNPANLLSVGASGAIVGLFVAAFTLSFHFPAGTVRSRLQARTLGTIAPALVPFLSNAQGATIDYGAHFGGAAAGLALGLLMLALWPKALPRPRFARAAGVVAAAGLALALAAVIPDLADYRRIPLYAELYEPWPATDAEARERAYDIVTSKPRDPRGHFVEALTLITAGDLPGAEAELRKGFADPDMLGLIPPAVVDHMRLVLAAVLLDEKRPDEARAAAAPICPAAKAGGPFAAQVEQLKLCR